MEITGPLSIGVIDNDTGGRELHLKFKPEFRVLSLPQQSEQFQAFINTLNKEIHTLEENDPKSRGQ